MKLEYHNILLNKGKSKQSINKNVELSVDLSGNKRLLPEDPIKSSVDAYEVYLNERTNCNKFRLIVNIVPYCSNVLFNPVTEVVKETNTGITVLNYSTGETISEGVVSKTFTKDEAIRDTQITDKHVGYKYYCGIDIFNNHILRSKGYKPVNYNRTINYNTGAANVGSLMPNGTTAINSQYYSNTYLSGGGNFKFNPKEVFNTIDDFMRDRYGIPIVDMFNKIPSVDESALIPAPLHLYQKYDIMSYEESVNKNLAEENGWYGFKNKTNKSLPLLIDRSTDLSDEYYIDRVINSKNVNDFIDMYPTRELFSFAPLYNKLKQRYEKNWNFCLTYPRYKVTDETQVPEFLTKDGGRDTFALKVDRFDENTVNDNGIRVVTIYSICQHGLRVGETINLYKNDSGEEVLLYNGATVVSVVDKYTFQIEKTGDDISTKWIDLNQYSENAAGEIVVNGYGQFDKEKYLLGTSYKVCGSLWVNVDTAVTDNLHFVKVVGGIECEYYIRKFSRVPNFKFAQEKVDLNTINDDVINRYNDPKGKLFTDFGNTTAKLGFSNSSYADGVVQTVYTDDIDVSSLKDHLGRPVSELYYTIIKNNKGYKDWYGIGTDVEPNKTTVEFSHCFGKVNSQFLLSDFYRWSKLGAVKDVRDITSKDDGLEGDIEFDKRDFYGDLCYYSPADCDEYVIQNVMARFNTVQREIDLYGASTADKFSSFKKDEIEYDEVSSESTKLFSLHNASTNYSKTSPVKSKGYYEGYYYQMHYKIPIKKVSSQLSYSDAIVYEIYSIEDLGTYASKIRTVEANDFLLNELIFIYNKETYETYTATVYEIYNSYSFAIEDKNKVLDLKEEDYDKFVIVKAHEDTPEYAKIIKDGSLRYYWREIVANGIENDSVVYPLTNGAFYINKMFNFFLRRQDPKKENLGNPSDNVGGSTGNDVFDYVPEGEYKEKYTNYDQDEYYESEEIDECTFNILKDTDEQYKLSETYQNITTLFS